MAATLVVVFGISSIVFLSVLLLAMAFLLRNRWDEMGAPSNSTRASTSGRTAATPPTSTTPTSSGTPPTPRRPRSPYLDQ